VLFSLHGTVNIDFHWIDYFPINVASLMYVYVFVFLVALKRFFQSRKSNLNSWHLFPT